MRCHICLAISRLAESSDSSSDVVSKMKASFYSPRLSSTGDDMSASDGNGDIFDILLTAYRSNNAQSYLLKEALDQKSPMLAAMAGDLSDTVPQMQPLVRVACAWIILSSSYDVNFAQEAAVSLLPSIDHPESVDSETMLQLLKSIILKATTLCPNVVEVGSLYSFET